MKASEYSARYLHEAGALAPRESIVICRFLHNISRFWGATDDRPDLLKETFEAILAVADNPRVFQNYSWERLKAFKDEALSGKVLAGVEKPRREKIIAALGALLDAARGSTPDELKSTYAVTLATAGSEKPAK